MAGRAGLECGAADRRRGRSGRSPAWAQALTQDAQTAWQPGPCQAQFQPVTRQQHSQRTAQRAHRQYLQHVAAAAWRDGHVTDAERADLLHVALLLDVPPSEALTILNDTRHTAQQPNSHQTPALRPGDKVVFTGDMDMNRADIEALATAAGLRVTTSVSSKTALVVAADPYTQSGKASTAANSASAWSPNRCSSTNSTSYNPKPSSWRGVHPPQR